ncbi:hypothetical protein [Cellvibrio sp. pealriver]|uniref:hypothetical protein n=1 Tax=Cellvibrio sp. pealriver TaxID=1622269 RepID=UPI00066FD236|nr:hypothetical protein [Cellvibrio sp. pealriver]
MDYVLFTGIFLFPFIVCLIYEAIAFKRVSMNGLFLTKVLSSYGIYLLGLIFSSISDPLEEYMLKHCSWSGEGIAPCNALLYQAASYISSWLILVMAGLSFAFQLVFLYYISRRITFNKA